MVISTKVTIDGTEYDNIDKVAVNRSMGDYNSVSTFTITLKNYSGEYNDTFNLHEEVKIYADEDTTPATTNIFTGVIEQIKFQGKGNNEKIMLAGRDYGSELQDVMIQPVIYSNRDIGEIANIVITQTANNLTTNNVDTNTGTTIDRIVFNRKNIFDILKQLGELSGYYFYVDENKDVHFVEQDTMSSGETFNNTNIIQSRFRTDESEIFNDVWVYGDRLLTGEEFSGGVDGGSVVDLTYKPHNVRVNISGTLQENGGIINLDDPYSTSGLKYVVDFNKSDIVFVSGTAAGDNIPGSASTGITIDFERSVPIVEHKENIASIGSYGTKTKFIKDDNIKDYSEAEDRASAFLTTHINPKIQGDIDVKGLPNLNPGETCSINVPFHNVDNQTYKILNLRYNFDKEKCRSGNVLKVTLNKKVSDFTDTMKEQMLRVKNLETGPIEGGFTYLQSNTGSFGVKVKNWKILTRDIGSSFILGHPGSETNPQAGGILGSVTASGINFLGDSRASLVTQQSGGTF